MKVVGLLALFVCIGASTACTPTHGSGRPGCRTLEEMQRVVYPNLWDNGAYWYCFTQNTPASAFRCPDGRGFLDLVRACVPFDIARVPAPNCEPPSLPPSN